MNVIEEADRIARPYHGAMQDDMKSAALYGYMKAIDAWKPDLGASFTTYARRRMAGEAAYQKRVWAIDHSRYISSGLADYLVLDPESSEPEIILRRIARVTSRRSARAAWLVWGLDLTGDEAGKQLGLSRTRVFQLLAGVRRALAS